MGVYAIINGQINDIVEKNPKFNLESDVKNTG